MKKIILLILISISTTLLSQPSCHWAYIPTGTSQTYNSIFHVAIDHSGNIIETGKILGSADMNPSSGPGDTSFSYVSYNYYLSKTDINGNLIWIKYFQNNSQIAFFEFKGLKINSSNEIILTGNFFGMVDFDLSDTGVDSLRSHFQTYPDFFIAKYDSSGDYKWAMNIGDSTTHSIETQAISILPNNDIIVGANPNGTIDVDPGPSVQNSLGINANLICYDNNGNFKWINNIGPVYSYSIPVNSLDCDSAGNSYILSVGYYELTVSKFDINGMRLWDKTIGDFSSGSRVEPQSVLIDKASGDFYVAGTFGDTVDFDPDAGVTNKISSSGFYQDGFIAKYDQNMNLLWVNAFVGEMSFGNSSLDFDNQEIIAAGNLTGNIDFGNGVILNSPATFNPFYIRLNSGGVTQNGFVLNGIGGFNTITKCNQSFVITGYITMPTDMDPTSDTLQLNTTTSNFFTAVYEMGNVTMINDNLSTHLLKAFPNPSSNTIYLTADEHLYGTGYVIEDFTGKTLMKGIISNEYTLIDLSNLSAGLYIISAGENSEYKLKIMKQ